MLTHQHGVSHHGTESSDAESEVQGGENYAQMAALSQGIGLKLFTMIWSRGFFYGPGMAENVPGNVFRPLEGQGAGGSQSQPQHLPIKI